MQHSEQINELCAALAKAQKWMKGAKKDAKNPYFKSNYADLAAVWEACRDALADNGLAVVQAPSTLDDGRVAVLTMLVHASGQWMSETLTAHPKDEGPQAMGSVITYVRRYALAAFAGVAAEDDDGEAASKSRDITAAAGPEPPPARVPAPGAILPPPDGYDNWWLDMETLAQEGNLAKLEAEFARSKNEYRKYMNYLDPQQWGRLKAKTTPREVVRG